MARHRNAKLTVGQCLVFDIGSLKQALKCVDSPTNSGEVTCSGVATWTEGPHGQLKAILGYEVGLIAGEGLFLLVEPERTSPFPPSVRLLAEYEVPITTTPTPIGGVRYWFRCPVKHDGKPCGRRVKKLYLPPGKEVFGCRLCHDLTYETVQKHDKRKAALAKDPAALDSALGSQDLRQASLGVGGLALLGKWCSQGRTRQLAKVSGLML